MATRKEKIKFVIIRTIGNFLVLFSIWGALMTLGPALYNEILYRVNQIRNVKYVVKAPLEKETVSLTKTLPDKKSKNTFFGQLTGGNKVEIIEPVSTQFGLVIPKINANVAVIPNVDAGDPIAYLEALQKGVAHAAGTVFPGVRGNMYLFAHSTDSFWNVGRYNAVFYLLKELQYGDEINIFFKQVRFIYKVVNTKIIDPKDVEYLTSQTPNEQLTLQTCWPPGTTFKRLVVIAKPERDFGR